MDYCFKHRFPPAQSWAWDEAERAYNEQNAPQNTKVQNGHIAQQPQERHSIAYSDGSRSVAEFMGDDERCWGYDGDAL